MIVYAVIVLIAGLTLAIWPERRADIVEKRISEGDDRFFEEQRAYHAYPWLRNGKHIRRIGILLALSGATLLAMAVYGKP